LGDNSSGYLNVGYEVSSLNNSVEFSLDADDLNIGDSFLISGVITRFLTEGIDWVDNFRQKVPLSVSDTSGEISDEIIVTESEIRVRDRSTGVVETAFYWNYTIDYDNHELSISFQENEEFDFSWMTTLVCAYIVPWSRGEDSGYFVRNSTKRRGTNPGTDTFNATFTHDFKDTEIKGFSFTRLILQPEYEYKDETIITNPWSSDWTFTDQSVLYSDDEYHMILGENTDGTVSGSNSSKDSDD